MTARVENRDRMTGKLLRLGLAGAAVAGALSACGDPLAVKANFETVTDTLTVFALTGTPVVAPSALNTYQHRTLRPEAGATHDVVFDIDASGRVVLYPAQLIGGQAAGSGPTGIR